MALAAEVWQQISVHDMVTEFLRSERHKPASLLPSADMGVVDRPDTSNPAENHLRLRLLLYFRCHLLHELPPDTQWFAVDSLHDDELDELLVLARCGLDNLAVNNELAQVVKDKAPALASPPSSWRKPILWGHDREGPFSIIEGNHRLLAYASAPQGVSIPVLVGVSPTPCFFHLPDPPNMLVNYLWHPSSWPSFRD